MNHNNLSQFKKLLRQLVLEVVYGGSQSEEAYSTKLVDDPSFNEESVYVSNNRKRDIKKWLKSMKLD